MLLFFKGFSCRHCYNNVSNNNNDLQIHLHQNAGELFRRKVVELDKRWCESLDDEK